MPTPTNLPLYEMIKRHADRIFDKPSAYKSGYIVKQYKRFGGQYEDDDKPKNLKKWFEEDWVNVNPLLGKSGYPTFRPTVRVDKTTPLTVGEIPKKRLLEQYELKQKIKGKKNLPSF
jgi:hypothetical protein